MEQPLSADSLGWRLRFLPAVRVNLAIRLSEVPQQLEKLALAFRHPLPAIVLDPYPSTALGFLRSLEDEKFDCFLAKLREVAPSIANALLADLGLAKSRLPLHELEAAQRELSRLQALRQPQHLLFTGDNAFSFAQELASALTRIGVFVASVDGKHAQLSVLRALNIPLQDQDMDIHSLYQSLFSVGGLLAGWVLILQGFDKESVCTLSKLLPEDTSSSCIVLGTSVNIPAGRLKSNLGHPEKDHSRMFLSVWRALTAETDLSSHAETTGHHDKILRCFAAVLWRREDSDAARVPVSPLVIRGFLRNCGAQECQLSDLDELVAKGFLMKANGGFFMRRGVYKRVVQQLTRVDSEGEGEAYVDILTQLETDFADPGRRLTSVELFSLIVPTLSGKFIPKAVARNIVSCVGLLCFTHGPAAMFSGLAPQLRIAGNFTAANLFQGIAAYREGTKNHIEQLLPSSALGSCRDPESSKSLLMLWQAIRRKSFPLPGCQLLEGNLEKCVAELSIALNAQEPTTPHLISTIRSILGEYASLITKHRYSDYVIHKCKLMLVKAIAFSQSPKVEELQEAEELLHQLRNTWICHDFCFSELRSCVALRLGTDPQHLLVELENAACSTTPAHRQWLQTRSLRRWKVASSSVGDLLNWLRETDAQSSNCRWLRVQVGADQPVSLVRSDVIRRDGENWVVKRGDLVLASNPNLVVRAVFMKLKNVLILRDTLEGSIVARLRESSDSSTAVSQSTSVMVKDIQLQVTELNVASMGDGVRTALTLALESACVVLLTEDTIPSIPSELLLSHQVQVTHFDQNFVFGSLLFVLFFQFDLPVAQKRISYRSGLPVFESMDACAAWLKQYGDCRIGQLQELLEERRSRIAKLLVISSRSQAQDTELTDCRRACLELEMLAFAARNSEYFSHGSRMTVSRLFSET